MALINAVPDPEPAQRGRKRSLSGDVPSPINRPPGCPFHPRCPWVQDICKTDLPPLREISPDHFAACHFAEPGKTTIAFDAGPVAAPAA
jgi:oligopeptide/dipeptide ABC transporter ATP-binding protein